MNTLIRTKYLIIVIILNLFSIGCSSLKKEIIIKQPREICTTTKQQFQNKNWKEVITQLEELNNNCLFNQYSQQIQLDLIYLYYKNADFQSAQTIIDRLIHLNPTHLNIDYIIYMRGLIKMALDENKVQNIFKIDNSGVDPQYALEAFEDFSKLTHNYPNSQYITDANRYIILLKNRLAKYEFLIADYYMHRGAWIAAINRIKNIISNYPDTQIVRDGLKMMESAYLQMKMNSQADRIKKIITNDNIKNFLSS